MKKWFYFSERYSVFTLQFTKQNVGNSNNSIKYQLFLSHIQHNTISKNEENLLHFYIKSYSKKNKKMLTTKSFKMLAYCYYYSKYYYKFWK